MNEPRTGWGGRLFHLAAGGAITLVLVLVTATLSAWPAWQSLPEGTALIRLSFTHSGARNCRERTAEELAALPPNMRQARVCDRRRSPVRIEMDIDGNTVFAESLPPSGLAGSGPSRVYERIELPAGSYRLGVRMRDDPAVEGFTHANSFDVQLAPGQSLAVDFNPTQGRFFIH